MRDEWIKLMMQVTGASKEAATKALKDNDDDVTNAIKELRETK
jgi:NACalpha-BTF3-like transcription factor